MAALLKLLALTIFRAELFWIWAVLGKRVRGETGKCQSNDAFVFLLLKLGKPSRKKSAVFLNIVQKAFDPPSLLFEHLSYFAGGVF